MAKKSFFNRLSDRVSGTETILDKQGLPFDEHATNEGYTEALHRLNAPEEMRFQSENFESGFEGRLSFLEHAMAVDYRTNDKAGAVRAFQTALNSVAQEKVLEGDMRWRSAPLIPASEALAGDFSEGGRDAFLERAIKRGLDLNVKGFDAAGKAAEFEGMTPHLMETEHLQTALDHGLKPGEVTKNSLHVPRGVSPVFGRAPEVTMSYFDNTKSDHSLFTQVFEAGLSPDRASAYRPSATQWLRDQRVSENSPENYASAGLLRARNTQQLVARNLAPAEMTDIGVVTQILQDPDLKRRDTPMVNPGDVASVRDDAGNTITHILMSQKGAPDTLRSKAKDARVLQLALKMGAPVDVPNDEGKTAIDIAALEPKSHMSRTLIEHMVQQPRSQRDAWVKAHPDQMMNAALGTGNERLAKMVDLDGWVAKDPEAAATRAIAVGMAGNTGMVITSYRAAGGGRDQIVAAAKKAGVRDDHVIRRASDNWEMEDFQAVRKIQREGRILEKATQRADVTPRKAEPTRSAGIAIE